MHSLWLSWGTERENEGRVRRDERERKKESTSAPTAACTTVYVYEFAIPKSLLPSFLANSFLSQITSWRRRKRRWDEMMVITLFLFPMVTLLHFCVHTLEDMLFNPSNCWTCILLHERTYVQQIPISSCQSSWWVWHEKKKSRNKDYCHDCSYALLTFTIDVSSQCQPIDFTHERVTSLMTFIPVVCPRPFVSPVKTTCQSVSTQK